MHDLSSLVDPSADSAVGVPPGGHPEVPADALIRRIGVVGNHLPRHCGIATFTTHLAGSLADTAPDLDCFVVAVNDPGQRHAYPGRVRFEIAEADPASYRRAADYLNVNGVDVVCVQHEFGIFGGKAGGHLLGLLRELRMPIVTTLHTILAAPSLPQRRVIDELAQLSQRLVVMSGRSAGVLASVYGVPEDRIDIIPHGIPQLPGGGESKHRLGVEGRWVLMTFGLLSPDKGIEFVIEALPAIAAAHPSVLYIILGATHPHVKAEHGEEYRVLLEARVRQLGLEQHVIFHDRFVSQDELNEFLSATDIYITPYLNPEQSTSGTLAYALGSGRAVISTPYNYARELLADGRGVLVPWRDPAAISSAVGALLLDDRQREALRERAAAHGRSMLWPAVAQQYHASFERAVRQQASDVRATFKASSLARRMLGLPELSLQHVRALTDDTGLLQHAKFCVPRYDEGYCLDDNARALLLMSRIEDAGTEDMDGVRRLAARYLAFVCAAFDETPGRFRNFMSYSRAWTESVGSEDSHGRAVHGLGTVIRRSSARGLTELSSQLFHAALPAVRGFTSPRAWASTLLGIDEYLHAFEGDRRVEELRGDLAERLLDLYVRASSPEWPWFEDRLTLRQRAAGPRHSRIRRAHGTCRPGLRRPGRARMAAVRAAKRRWTVRARRDQRLRGTGSHRGRVRPAADRGIDHGGGVSRSGAGHRRPDVDPERPAGLRLVPRGESLATVAVRSASGGCRDGLHAERANENQGAESTLAFLLALVDMRGVDRDIALTGSSQRA